MNKKPNVANKTAKAVQSLSLGCSVFLAFLGSALLASNMVGTSSPTYKAMIDDAFGVKHDTGISTNADTYTYLSDFKNSVDLISSRAEIAKQLEEEGAVLLKNNNSLPLKSNQEQTKKVTILGSRAYTFKDNKNRTGVRDGYQETAWEFRQMNSYAGICGSRTYQSTVTLNSGFTSIPITLIDALEKENIKVNPSGERAYANKPFPNPPVGNEANGVAGGPFAVGEPHITLSELDSLDEYNDAAIVVIGRMSGEGREYFPGYNGILDHTDGSKSALNLSNEERNLIDQANALSSNVVVLLNSAIPMEIEELKNDERVDSILWIGLPGSYGMTGVGEILSGKISPSGGLPDVYAVDASVSPAAQNFGTDSQDGGSFTWSNPGDATQAYNGHYVVLAEGIYDGYYYYETRYNDTVLDVHNAKNNIGLGREAKNNTWSYEDEVSYTFGYGLSYSDFEITPLEANGSQYTFNKDTMSLEFGVKVKNIGNVPAKKSVQLYLSSPYTEYDANNSIEKSAIQLVGFNKTKLLEPNQDETLSISVPLKYIASYSEKVAHDGVNGGYILEDATYHFAYGNGAHEALNNILVKKDASNDAKIYKEANSVLDTSLVIEFNPAQDVKITELERGTFTDGINAVLLNKDEDGTIIQNQIQNANYNFYKANTVTFLSRNDWANTFPVAYPNLEITADMEIYLGKNKGNGGHVYQFKNGSVDTLWGVDHTFEEDDEGKPLEQEVIANFKNAAFDDPRWDYLLEQITFKEASTFGPAGGASCNAFLSINAPDAYQADGPNGNLTGTLSAHSSNVGPMALQDDDVNAQYKSCDMPCEPIIAGTFNESLVEEEGKSFGEMSLWDNYHILWAPGMNLHRTPFNSRNHEYYSEDPMLTNIMGRAFVKGGLIKGAILSAKHFAFNTQESYREGLSQFFNEQSGRELELRGFQGLFEDINFETSTGNIINSLGLMSSFSRVGCTGVNAHTGLMVNILREEWDFRGLISTDFVATGKFFNPQDCAANNVTFMACGNSDQLLNGDWIEYKNKVATDPYLNEQLKKNMHYYLFAIENSAILNGFDANTKAVDAFTTISPWQIGLVVGGSVALFIAAVGFALHVFTPYLPFFKEKDVAQNENEPGKEFDRYENK